MFQEKAMYPSKSIYRQTQVEMIEIPKRNWMEQVQNRYSILKVVISSLLLTAIVMSLA